MKDREPKRDTKSIGETLLYLLNIALQRPNNVWRERDIRHIGEPETEEHPNKLDEKGRII